METLRILLFLQFSLNFSIHTISSQHTMNIQSQGLRTTIYKVEDLAAAKNWYARVFGIQPYFDEPFYVGFNIAGYELGLLPASTTGPKTENVLSYWGVADITDAYDKMISQGATELEQPNDVGGGIKVALVKDPWQNVIGLITNPHFQLSEPTTHFVEIAPFEIKPQVSEAALLAASLQMQADFLEKQPGFVKRHLLQKSATAWMDIVYWESKEAAERALLAFESSPACAAYFQLMNMDTLAPPVHYQLKATY